VELNGVGQAIDSACQQNNFIVLNGRAAPFQVQGLDYSLQLDVMLGDPRNGASFVHRNDIYEMFVSEDGPEQFTYALPGRTLGDAVKVSIDYSLLRGCPGE